MKLLNDTVQKIEKIDYSLAAETQERLDFLTKPQGSLGRLEELAKQVVEITRFKNPQLKNKVVFVMAGDHGVTQEGVSAYPSEVTPQIFTSTQLPAIARGPIRWPVSALTADAGSIAVTSVSPTRTPWKPQAARRDTSSGPRIPDSATATVVSGINAAS